STGKFSLTGNITRARYGHTATLLADGRVLMAGGYGDSWSYISTAEIYDPASGVFTATGQLIKPRAYGTTSILLPNGKVLIVGGYGPHSDSVERAELYDPATGAFVSAGDYVLPDYCDFCAPAVRLADGKVLFAEENLAQLYDP